MASTRYWREISAVLVLKAMALLLLYVLIVAPNLGPPMTPRLVAGHVAGPIAGTSGR